MAAQQLWDNGDNDWMHGGCTLKVTRVGSILDPVEFDILVDFDPSFMAIKKPLDINP